LRHTVKSENAAAETAEEETAEEQTTDEKVAQESPAAAESPTAEKTAPGQTDRRPDTARTRGGAHARGRRRGIGRSTIWKPVFAIALLVLLATAVTLVLLQSAGVIDWGFLGPNA
jgi:hypothetical protein